MFKIIKKASGWWHEFNGGSKLVNLSDFNIVLDDIAQTYVIQSLNGSNIPNQAVGIADIEVIDETDASVVETFATVELLRVRLQQLNYTPYLDAGAIQSIVAGTNVTVDDTDPLNPIVSASGGGGATWGGIAGTLSDQTDLNTALNGKVDENASITGATKTKITYDSKGLVTSGADATTADIADSTNKRYQTDNQNTYNDATSSIQDQFDAITSPTKITLTDASTTTWDFSTGSFAQWTIGGNRTLSITNLPSGVVASGILKLIQNGTGGYIPTLSGNSNDVDFRLGASEENLIGFYWDGTNLYWSSSYHEGGSGTGATLATPDNFIVTVVTDDAITMTWDAVTNATGYTIERDTTAGFTSPTTVLTYSNVLTYTDTGLAPLTTYYYRIKALAVGFITSNWVVTSDTTDAPSGYLTWLTLGSDATYGCEQYNSSKGIRRKTTTDGFGSATGVAVSNETLSNGQRLKFKINAINKAVIVSLGTSTASDSQSGGSGLNFGIYVGYGLTNSLGRMSNGTYDNTPNQTYVAGDWAALYYDGSSIRLQHSTDGVTFTTWRTAAATPSGSYNVQIQFYSGKSGSPAFGLDEVIIS